MGADLHWPEGEGILAEEVPGGDASWSHEVDLESTDGNEAEEDALAAPAPGPLSPIDKGAPPGEEADPQPDEPAADPDGGEDGKEMVGDALSVAERVARALSRRPEASVATQPAPPWRDGSRPPRETAHPQGGSRHRAAPPPSDSAQPSGRNLRGNRDAQRARMGFSSSSTAGGPDAPPAYPALGSNDGEIPARLAEALRLAEEARVQAEAAQAEVARLEAEAYTEPWTPAETLLASRDPACDRSRSARAQPQAERPKPTLTARAMTPSAIPAPQWPPNLPKPPPVVAPQNIPKAQSPPGKARQHPIGAPPPQASAPEEDYEIVEDETPRTHPKLSCVSRQPSNPRLEHLLPLSPTLNSTLALQV